MILLPLVLAVLATLVAGSLAWREYRRTHELFTPWLLFLVYAILDVFLPAAVFLAGNPPTLASWMVPLRKEDIATATLLYLVSLAFFAGGYFFVSRRTRDEEGATAWQALADVRVNVRYVYVGLVVAGGWYVSHQLTLMNQAGSFDVYLSERFRQRFRPEIFESRNVLDFVFNQFAPSMLPLFLVLVGVLFFFRHRYGRPILWGWVLPVVAWLLTLTTFYRGYQLNFFLSLAFIESCRVRAVNVGPAAAPATIGSTRTKTVTTRTKVLAAVAVLVFLVYGAYREYNSSFTYGRPVTVTAAISSQGGELVRGWGTVGLASILHAYEDGGSRLGGTSVVTTLFMPVPRPVWPGKPERYGAEEVTRRMGWPSTTQSAITVPGELYANFGLLGLPAMAALGFLFRYVYRRRLDPRLFFAYAFFVPHAVLLTHWMSATGLMTSLTLYALGAGAVHLVVRQGDADAFPHVDDDEMIGPDRTIPSGRRSPSRPVARAR